MQIYTILIPFSPKGVLKMDNLHPDSFSLNCKQCFVKIQNILFSQEQSVQTEVMVSL